MARKPLNAKTPTPQDLPQGAPPNHQDMQRRLGNFTTAGEPPRKGYRTTGINGPQKKQEARKSKNSK